MTSSEDIVVFSQYWKPFDVRTAILTAKQKCTDCRIVYLHDEWTELDLCESHNMGAEFSEMFERLNTDKGTWGSGNEAFERCCIARWYAILRWMDRLDIGRASFCDSDVLLFSNPFKSPHNTKPILLSKHHNGSVAGSCSILTRRFVADIINMAIRVNKHGPHNGKTNDMSFITELAKEWDYSEQNRIVDGVAFDHNMGDTLGWESKDGYKVLRWGADGSPYGIRHETGEVVRLINLHCWGEAEHHIKDIAAMGGVV